MQMINLYLAEIEKHLPARNREDVLKEIQSTLMDMIEDRNSDSEQPPNDDLIISVLQVYGEPRQVAQKYIKYTSLIGPRMYPTYLQVLKIVLAVLAGINLIGIIITIATFSGTSLGLFETIAQVIGGLFNSLFLGFGIVSLVFAIIERTLPADLKIKIGKEWTSEDLLSQKDHHTIKIAEIALEIIFTLAFVVLINFFLDRIGIYYLGETGWMVSPILNQNFNRYIPLLTVANLLSIVLNLFLIRKGRWNKATTVAKLVINVFTIGISIAILTGPNILTLDPSAWNALDIDISKTAAELTGLMNMGMRILIGLSIFGLVLESIKRLVADFFNKDRARSLINAK